MNNKSEIPKLVVSKIPFITLNINMFVYTPIGIYLYIFTFEQFNSEVTTRFPITGKNAN